MKSLRSIIVLWIALTGISSLSPCRASAQDVYVTFSVFYDDLSPYGDWVDYPEYGYVWIPTFEPDFVPYYTGGHWIYTNHGWAWISDYSWGWAPFHYGRWNYSEVYGWFWVPDVEWGPAWVVWRRSEGYYGWAPMTSGVTLSVTLGGDYNIPNDRWIFVRDRDIMRRDINLYYIDRSSNVTIINNSSVIQNTYVDNSRNATYVAGPSREDVQRVTGNVIQPVAVQSVDRPGQNVSNEQLQIYRPKVQKKELNANPAPSKVVQLKDVKPVSERKMRKKDDNPSRAPLIPDPAARDKDRLPPGNKEQPLEKSIPRPPSPQKDIQQKNQPPQRIEREPARPGKMKEERKELQQRSPLKLDQQKPNNPPDVRQQKESNVPEKTKKQMAQPSQKGKGEKQPKKSASKKPSSGKDSLKAD